MTVLYTCNYVCINYMVDKFFKISSLIVEFLGFLGVLYVKECYQR